MPRHSIHCCLSNPCLVCQPAKADEPRQSPAETVSHDVFVPGTWCCPKCQFVLVQSNLNAADGTVTARDQPGDKCPNCDSPLWRVTWRQQAKEMGERAEQEILRSRDLQDALKLAVQHIEHMAAWITKANSDYHVGVYSFESLGEDLPTIKAPFEQLTKSQRPEDQS